MLRAIDISSWQAGIVPSWVDCDVVIVKATGGTGYENPYWREWADDVLASGKLLAFYHFANDLSWNSASAEAEWFLSHVRDYKGQFVPILDWEGMALNNPVSWAREWLDIVSAELGATPIFYAYASNVAWVDYSSISHYPLWMASYLNRYDGVGWVDNPDNVWGTGSWGGMVGYQYTSTGYVNGYGGRLDLSVFYMSRDDWLDMQGNGGDKVNRNAEMVDLLMGVSTDYVFGGTRYDIYRTDCSGVVCGAFYRVFGLDPYILGVDTGSQWSRGTLAKLWWGTTPDLPWEDMYKGDVIFTSNCSPDFSTANGSHVGFYTGDPAHPFQSHFANGGPYITAVNGVYGGTECYFGVARYREGIDDMQPANVWEYNYQNSAVGGNMYNAVNGIAQAVLEPHESSAGDGTSGSMRDRLEWVDMRVREMSEDVAEIKRALGGAPIEAEPIEAEFELSEEDVDAIAEAVADKLAARMAQ